MICVPFKKTIMSLAKYRNSDFCKRILSYSMLANYLTDLKINQLFESHASLWDVVFSSIGGNMLLTYMEFGVHTGFSLVSVQSAPCSENSADLG
jgi:hypothetical protein